MNRVSRPLAVGFLSAGTLAYEILLVRLFAIEQFYHFAYMAIGVAMLGFGAAGTGLALVTRRARNPRESWYRWAAVAAAVALLLSPLIADRIPVDVTQVLWDQRQWPRLAALYLVLALPFGLGALAVLLGIALDTGRPGTIYGASFVGSGAGAAAAVAVLWVLAPPNALALPALLAACGALAAVGLRPRHRASALVWITAAAALVALMRPLWRLEITPYKGLPQASNYPDARRVGEFKNPVGWLVTLEASAFRFAPGLSLRYTGAFPEQTGLFLDGQTAGALSRWTDGSARMLEWLPASLPYALGGRSRVLLVGGGSGLGVAGAVSHGADRITAAELHPHIARLADNPEFYPTASNGTPTTRWAVGDARSYVARTDETFDLISLGPEGGLGSAAGGVYSLNEDFLHTVEAYEAYLERLRPGGVVAITRWLVLPPRESVRIVFTAARALRRVAPGSVERGLVVVRSWGTVTVLIRPAGFAPEDVAALEQWARERRFDVDWRPGGAAPSPEFNRLGDGTIREATRAAVAGGAAARRYAAEYPFDISPATDARPYPHHFLRTSAIGRLLERGQGEWLPFAEWGYLALVATLVQSTLLAAALMVLPTLVGTRASLTGHLIPLIAYFGAIGFAYLAAEIAAIQQLGLLLGHPVYAVAAVLTVLLICSGAGSMWSDRVALRRGRVAVALLTPLLLGAAWVLLDLVHALQGTALPVRAVVAMAILAPLAFLMGLPFPLGLRSLTGDVRAGVPWAWAANGFASVVAAPLAAIVALEAGSAWLLALAALAYAAATLIIRSAPLKRRAS